MSEFLKTRVGKMTSVFAGFAVTLAFAGSIAFVPASARADTISDLMAQIAALQAQLVALQGGGTATATGSCTFTKSLTVGSRGEDVKCLQQYLNANGYPVAASGAGSAGNETTYFGQATRGAVAKWQAAMGVSPAVGYFGTISRAKFSSMATGTTPVPTPGTGTTPVPTPGTGLSVMAGTQPVAALAPLNAARIPFT